MNLKKLSENFNIFPVEGNGDKAPMIIRDEAGNPILGKNGNTMRFVWSKVKEEKLSYEYLSKYDTFGVACGVDGLEVIDVDNHFGDADKLFEHIRLNYDISDFFVVKTAGGGYHIYYKTDAETSNKKFASRPRWNEEKQKFIPDVLVESRGNGGYVVFYADIVSGDIDNITFVEKEKLKELHSVCCSLNEWVAESNKKQLPKNKDNADSPGTMYENDLGTIDETKILLENEGWTSKDGMFWTRPGKKEGISATFQRVGGNTFYNFSSNGHPFQVNTGYSMFGVRAELLHGGDYSTCARELAERYDIKPANKVSNPIGVDEPKYYTKWDCIKDIIKDWDLKFRYNVLMKCLEYCRSDGEYKSNTEVLTGDIMMEMETNRFEVAAGKKKKISISKAKISDMLLNNSICDIYNPIDVFISSIPKWDGVERYGALIDCIELDYEENRMFFTSMIKKHLIRSIQCATTDYVNRYVVVLFGGQDIGKTLFIKWLCYHNEVYSDEQIDPSEKDSILALARYLMLNMDELDSLNKKEVSKLKAFISKGDITRRVSYGRHDEKFKRVASLWGSTNESDILTDSSNTRWIILRVLNFDWKKYTNDIDIVQLWAEAKHCFEKDNESGFLSRDEKDLINIRNSNTFLQSSVEREILQRYFVESDDYKMNLTEVESLISRRMPEIKVNRSQLIRELKRIYGQPVRSEKNGVAGRYYLIRDKFPGRTDVSNFYETEKEEDNNSKNEIPF